MAGHLPINPTTATKPIAWEVVPTVEPGTLQNSLLCANQSVWLIAGWKVATADLLPERRIECPDRLMPPDESPRRLWPFCAVTTWTR